VRSTTATYFDQDGILQTAAANQGRITFDPSTLDCQGLLIEEQRTNSILQSENFGTTWVTTNSSVSTNVTTAPDGTTTADKLTEALDVTSVHQVAQTSVTVMSSATYTASVYAKADTRTRVRIAFIVGGTGGVLADANLTSGTIGAATSFGGGTAVTSAIQSVGNGWFRILITGSGPAGTSGELRCELLDATGNRQYNGDGTSGLFLWGAQLEAGAFPTSYIPTTTTALTRNADVASMTGTNFSGWFNATEGTVVAIGQMLSVSGPTSRSIFDITDGSTVNRINGRLLTASIGDQATIRSGGTTQFQAASINNTTTAIKNFVVAYKTSDFAVTSNGSVPVTQASGAIAVGVNQMQLGNAVNSVEALCGTIRRIAYYPVRVTDAQLRALTG
jgi:hypothetical protein